MNTGPVKTELYFVALSQPSPMDQYYKQKITLKFSIMHVCLGLWYIVKIQCITIKTMLAMMAQLHTVTWSDHCAVSYKVKPASRDPMVAMTQTVVIFAAVHTLCYDDLYSWFQMRFSCIVVGSYQVLNISPSLSCRLRVTLHVVKCSTIMNIHYWWKWLLAIT